MEMVMMMANKHTNEKHTNDIKMNIKLIDKDKTKSKNKQWIMNITQETKITMTLEIK